MASIGELFIELGIKADNQKVNNIDQGFKSLNKNLLLVSAAFTGAIVGLDRFVNSALKGVVALQNLNNQTGLSIEKLQQFQQAGQLSNLALDADQIAQSIANVQKNLADIRIGQGNLAPFQLLGIDVAGQDAFGVIDQLRDSIKGLDPALASNLISQLGLSPEFINILKLSRQEFEALSENTFLNPKQRADIDKAGTSMKALELRLKALKDQAVAKLAPELNKLIRQFFNWIKENGDKVINVITSIVNGFVAFSRAISNAIGLATRFINSTVGMENALKVLGAAFAFLTLRMSPVLLSFAALVLLLDDIAIFKAGGDSLIGNLVSGLEGIPKLTDIFGEGGNIVDIMSGITDAMVIMTAAAIALAAPLVAITGALSFLAKAPSFGKFLGEKLDKTSFGKGVGDFGSKAKNTILDLFDRNKEGFAGLSTGAFRKDGSGGVTNNVTVSVTGVQNPEEVAREIERVLNQGDLNRTQAAQGNDIR